MNKNSLVSEPSNTFLNQLFGLHGQVAVIIGGAGELGGALAAGLGQAGSHIVIADTDRESCDRRGEKLTALSVSASSAVVNITQRESLEQLLVHRSS